MNRKCWQIEGLQPLDLEFISNMQLFVHDYYDVYDLLFKFF